MDRERVRELVESSRFEATIMTIVVVNSIIIGIQTAHLPQGIDFALTIIDNICLAIYIVEACLKIYAYHGSYFKDGWNIFDFTIIVLSLIPAEILPIPAQAARVLRVFRAFRAFRLISAFKQMRVIVEAVGKYIPGVAGTGVLLIILFYVFAIIGTTLFGEAFPEYFGNLGDSFYTLFQVMTLESWSAGVSRPVMEVFPWAWVYFVPFVIISAFIMVNVVVGIVVGTIDESREHLRREEEMEAMEQGDEHAKLMEEIDELKGHLATIEGMLADQEERKKLEERS